MLDCVIKKLLGTLISDIVMAKLRARQCNGVVRRCAKAPCDVRNASRCRNECTQYFFTKISGVLLIIKSIKMA